MSIELTQAQQIAIDRLSPSDLKTIDASLIEICTDRWQKAAKIVGTLMLQNKDRYADIPDTFFASRLFNHVEGRQLEYQGTLGCIRQCEVRVAGIND